MSILLCLTIWEHHYIFRASLVAQLVKNLSAMQETWVWPLGWEDPLEKGKATHSSILAWRIPWTTVQRVTKSRTWLSDFHLCISDPYYVYSDTSFSLFYISILLLMGIKIVVSFGLLYMQLLWFLSAFT